MARSENSSSDDNFYSSQDQEVNQKKPQLEFSADEEDLIIRMYNLIGERWHLIAGRIPGRTAEEIERYCKARFSSTSGSKK